METAGGAGDGDSTGETVNYVGDDPAVDPSSAVGSSDKFGGGSAWCAWVALYPWLVENC